MKLQRLLYPDIVIPLLTFGAVSWTKEPISIIMSCAFVAWAWISALWEEELEGRPIWH